MASPSLIFLAGPNAGRRYKLAGGEFIIGRRSDCQIFVPDMRVSRQHARIHPAGDHWLIEDLGSNNGTFVNGERVQSTRLKHDDEITIANNRIRVEMPKQGKSKPDSPVTIVEVENPSVYVSREESSESSIKFWRRQSIMPTDPGSPRLLERKLHALQTILEIAANVADPDKLMESVVAQLLEVFSQAHSVGVLVEDERTGELKVRCHRSRKQSDYPGSDPRIEISGSGSDQIGISHIDNFSQSNPAQSDPGIDLKVPGTIIEHVVRDHRGVLLVESHDEGSLEQSKPAPEPNGSRMGAPLQARNVHYGVIYVECRDRSFRQEDLDLLTSVAAQTGLAIHTARMHAELLKRERLERDLRVARQIQRSLMRDPPRATGLDFAVHYEPAYQIGGDFYDFIWHDNEHLAIVVGDVAGKAISAALYMARLTSELRGRAGIAHTPERLLDRVNEEMVRLGDDGMFATLIYAVYELPTRTLTFTNAGHCVPLLRRGENVFPLHADQAHVPPIGILPNLEVGEAQVQLYSDDLLVLVSDGIIEAHDPHDEEYGVKRLSQCIRTAQGTPEDVVKAILQDVDSHVAGGVQSDDMTIVAMNISDTPARRLSGSLRGVAIPPDPGKSTI